jgi:hypothetical protein
LVAEVTSTTGDAPVTVIVSSSAPTPSSALTVAVNSDGSCRPTRLNVALHFFNQHVAGCFDGDTRHCGTG